MAETMPAIFIGHGTPMNALTKNSYTAGWASLGKTLPRPKAILAVSAHWYIQGCAVTVNSAQPTIHDFGGFPKELYEIQYPAPGSPELARQVRDLLSPVPVGLDESWGIDHGTWSVLVHLFPNANIPVVQLSIDSRQAPFFHYELGKRLMSLREEGILILGSGNVVHNLSAYVWGDSAAPAFDWAMRFENRVRQLVLTGDARRVVDYHSLGPDALLAVPTPEHYLPLLYLLGLRKDNEPISFPVEGVEGGSVSMFAVRVG